MKYALLIYDKPGSHQALIEEELAARVPSARLGGKVEVRPIVEQSS